MKANNSGSKHSMPDGVPADVGKWALISAILASAMSFVDASALNVALPALQADLAISGAQLLWVVNAYALMIASFMMIGGSLGDRLGRKKVFMTGIGLFLLASLACGLAPTGEFLIWARAAQGIGGALMIPSSLALITTSFSPDERGGAIGTWSAATTLVTLAGPLLGGFLADVGLWRGVFLLNIPVGITALAALHFRVPARREKAPRPVNYRGAILGALGLGGLTFGFMSMPVLGTGDPRVYGMIAFGIVALITSIISESRSEDPMIPLSLFRSRTFSGCNLLTLFLYGGLYAGIFFFALNLVQAQGYSQSLAGAAFLPVAILIAALSRWSGGLADRHGPRLPLIVGPFLAGLGFIFMAFVSLTNGPSDYWTTYFPGVVMLGLGLALTVAPLTATVMGSVASQYAGTSSGINNALSRIAGVLAIAVMGAVALSTFAGMLQANTSEIDLSPEARVALRTEAGKLGGASVPKEVKPEQVGTVELIVRRSFVDTFQMVMLICAGLAWLGTAAAATLIESDFKPVD